MVRTIVVCSALALALLLAHRSGAQSKVYRCVIDGVVSYSDRPCGSEARLVTVPAEHVSRYEAPDLDAPGPAVKKRAASRTKSQQGDEGQSRKRERCAKLDSDIERIETRQRAGYKAKEGVRLEDRRRELKERRREMRC